MISIDYTDKRPIYEQITERIQSLVLCGVYEKDTMLPSVRNLAMDLSINPNTIQRAYSELEHRGVIYTVKGKGNFVADNGSLQKIRMSELENTGKHLVKQAKELGVGRDEFVRMIIQLFETVDMKREPSEEMRVETGGEGK